jgi:hypothetical protein
VFSVFHGEKPTERLSFLNVKERRKKKQLLSTKPFWHDAKKKKRMNDVRIEHGPPVL